MFSVLSKVEILNVKNLNIENRRVFGPGDWGNTGRYIWDAANIKYSNRFLTTQMVFGYNIMHQPNVFPNVNKEGTYAFATFNSIKNLPFLIDLFYVYKYDETGKYISESNISGNLYASYIGSKVQKTHHNLNLMFLGAYQFGKYATDKISAFGITTQLNYKFNTTWKPELMLTYIYASGDNNLKNGIHQTFDGIFSGSDTDLYSWMNFIFWKNVHQYRADLILNPAKKISVRSEYHAYFLDKTKDAWCFPGKAMRQDKQGLSGSFVGQELDFISKIKIFKWFQFWGGYCFFVPGDFVKKTGNSPLAQWFFGELTFIL